MFLLIFAFGCGQKAGNTPDQSETTPETSNTNPNEKPTPQAPPKRPAPTGDTYANDIGMEFVRVPKGTLWSHWGKREIPDDFYIGVYEVTQEEWTKVMVRNPSYFSEFGGAGVKGQLEGIPKDDLKRFPVEKVSWQKAGEFASYLNTKCPIEGWSYRLPSHIQWEYAARGAQQDKEKAQLSYHFKSGPTNTLTTKQANFGYLELLSQPNLPGSLKRTCKVGSYEPNELGIYDMHGNVWEWCADSHPESRGEDRVRCGGAFSTTAADCSAGNRGRGMIYYRGSETVSSDTGLRVVLVPVKQASTPPVVKPNPTPTPNPPVKTEPEVSKVTALGLVGMLKADKKAESRYKNKLFHVEGTVAKLDVEHNIVTLTGSKIASVLCFFGQSGQADFAQLKIGQKVTVKGLLGATTATGDAQLLKCEVVK
jgi:formylglycine-generating enzyme required for sulfatase activity